MRLPVIDENDSKVDQAVVDTMVNYTKEHGVNYFDIVYGYHGEMSEVSTGNTLGRHFRDSYYLADKFPGYNLSNMPKVKEIFGSSSENETPTTSTSTCSTTSTK